MNDLHQFTFTEKEFIGKTFICKGDFREFPKDKLVEFLYLMGADFVYFVSSDTNILIGNLPTYPDSSGTFIPLRIGHVVLSENQVEQCLKMYKKMS